MYPDRKNRGLDIYNIRIFTIENTALLLEMLKIYAMLYFSFRVLLSSTRKSREYNFILVLNMNFVNFMSQKSFLSLYFYFNLFSQFFFYLF